MAKITYKINNAQGIVKDKPLHLNIKDGRKSFTSIFFALGEIVYWKPSKRYQLYLYDKDDNVLNSFYIKPKNLIGCKYLIQRTL